MTSAKKQGGYTLIELIVAVGLFAIIMLLASGAYYMMIGLNRQSQAVASGIDNLSFALETMTRVIRTGSSYNCGGTGDCVSGANTFSFRNDGGAAVTYDLYGGALRETVSGLVSNLTDSRSITVTSLTFYTTGTKPVSLGDYLQPNVVVIISGTVVVGPGKPLQTFTVETNAVMRGTDL